MAIYSSVTVEFDIAIPMRDGAVLRADIYRPASPGPFPVLLQRTPYNKGSMMSKALLLDLNLAATNGYAVVIQDCRGRFTSEGTFYPFREETADGYDTVEWCASQSWCNGKVGMFGNSYVGATQWLAAVGTPPHLAAIVPDLTASQYYDGWTYQGGALQLNFTTAWATNFTLADLGNTAKAIPGALDDRQQLTAVLDGAPGSLEYLPLKEFPALKRPGLAPCYYDWLAHPSNDEYWQEWSIENKYDQVHAAAFNLGGWYDIFLGGTLKNFTGMRERGGTSQARRGQKLLVGPWVHAPHVFSKPGQIAPGFGSSHGAVGIDGLLLRWFDYWLKGEENGVMDEPPVRLFIMGANTWRDETQWPPQDVEYVNFYLHSDGGANTLNGDGKLSAETSAEEPEDVFLYDPRNPVPTLGGALAGGDFGVGDRGGLDQRPLEARQDVLVYSSTPLDRDTEVTGPISVTIYAASSAPDTDFTAKLVDVHPSGEAVNIADGIIRARYRESLATAKAIEPGKVYEYSIDLVATSNLFKTGHQIRLEVSSSNFPRFDRNPNTGEEVASEKELRPALQRIYHGGDLPSHVRLPILRR